MGGEEPEKDIIHIPIYYLKMIDGQPECPECGQLYQKPGPDYGIHWHCLICGANMVVRKEPLAEEPEDGLATKEQLIERGLVCPKCGHDKTYHVCKLCGCFQRGVNYDGTLDTTGEPPAEEPEGDCRHQNARPYTQRKTIDGKCHPFEWWCPDCETVLTEEPYHGPRNIYENRCYADGYHNGNAVRGWLAVAGTEDDPAMAAFNKGPTTPEPEIERLARVAHRAYGEHFQDPNFIFISDAWEKAIRAIFKAMSSPAKDPERVGKGTSWDTGDARVNELLDQGCELGEALDQAAKDRKKEDE